MDGVGKKWGSNIYYIYHYINTFSWFRFFRNSQHPEMWMHQLLLDDMLKFAISVLEKNF